MGAGLSSEHIFSHLVSMTTLRSRSRYYPHFTSGEWGTKGVSNFTKTTQLYLNSECQSSKHCSVASVRAPDVSLFVEYMLICQESPDN